MIEEASTTTSAQEVTATVEVPAKMMAKKTSARKPAMKKPAIKKPLTGKKAVVKDTKKSFDDYFSAASLKESRDKISESVDRFSGVIKSIAYFQLGVCGKIYDEVSSMVDVRRAKAAKQLSVLIKRGEKIQKTIQKKQKGFEKRIKAVDVRGEIKDGVGKVKASYKGAYGKFKSLAKKAA